LLFDIVFSEKYSLINRSQTQTIIKEKSHRSIDKKMAVDRAVLNVIICYMYIKAKYNKRRSPSWYVLSSHFQEMGKSSLLSVYTAAVQETRNIHVLTCTCIILRIYIYIYIYVCVCVCVCLYSEIWKYL